MDFAHRALGAVVTSGVVLSLAAACGPTESDAQGAPPPPAERAAVTTVSAKKPANTGTPSAKRLAAVGYVVDNGFMSQSVGQQMTSTRLSAGQYRIVVRGVRPGCEAAKPRVFLTPEATDGRARVAALSTECDSGDVSFRVARTTFGGNERDGGFYLAVYRGKGPAPGVANPRPVAVGQVSAKGREAKVQSDYRVNARRYAKGRYEVEIKRLDKGCTYNAPMTILNLLGKGETSVVGGGVDCASGGTSLPYNVYSPGGARKNAAFTFQVYRGQTVAASARRPLKACQLEPDAKSAC